MHIELFRKNDIIGIGEVADCFWREPPPLSILGKRSSDVLKPKKNCQGAIEKFTPQDIKNLN